VSTDRGRKDDLSARSRWWDRRTLRFRILTSLLAIMLVAFAVIGVVTVVALNRFLLGRLDQQLGAAGARYVAAVDEPSEAGGSHGDGDDDLDDGFGDARGQQVETLGARIVAGRLAGLGIVGHARPATIAASDRRTLLAVKVGHPTSSDLGAFGDYRLRAFALSDSNRVVVGLPLHPVHETLAELLAVELAVFGVVLLATIATSGWLVGLSLRPLARVTNTARKVSDSPLADSDRELTPRAPTPNPATEVGQLGLAFNHMLDHVEASLITRRDSEDRLRRFIADASHELRTPVAAIRAHAESVRHAPEQIPEPVLQSLARIESEAIRMGVLVDDLLLLARLDAGRPLAEASVDLSRIAIEVTDDARVAGRAHRWLLDLPHDPVVVIGDDHRIREIVTNLLTNARAHTPVGTTVELALSVDASTNSALLSATDDGPGIPPESQLRVFERFYRVGPARAPLTGSSGLGLAIVAAVAHAHGGDVSVESKPGRTCFTVRLPLPAPPPTDESVGGRPPGDGASTLLRQVVDRGRSS
jgi:two-component system, OmpR family, sensor kinase